MLQNASMVRVGGETGGQGGARADQTFWVYKRGQLVLIVDSAPGPFIPTSGTLDRSSDPDGMMSTCAWASGQFLSLEWEPRVRALQRRAGALAEFIELLQDRHYDVDREPPSQRVRPFRSL